MNTDKKVVEIGVLDQVSIASKKSNRLALVAGSVMGGFVPIATCALIHLETAERPMMWLMVAGGLGYSALSVCQTAQRALKSQWKAVGFTLLLEGILAFSDTKWLWISSLSLLVVINAVAASCNLIMDRRETRRKK